MRRRKPAFVFALVLAIAMGLLGEKGRILAEGKGSTAPFRMTPNGKPDALIGGLQYEAPSALAFDSKNQPYMFHSREPESFGHILTLRDGKWIKLSYMSALYLYVLERPLSEIRLPKQRYLHALGSITIDDADSMYAIVYLPKGEAEPALGGARVAVLLYSPDLGESFQVYELPDEFDRATLEIRVGHNDISGPPAIGLLKHRQNHPATWGNYNRLSVLLPRKKGNTLELGDPVRITDRCFGMSNHSGGYSFAVTDRNKTHLVYGEIPKDGGEGNPTYVATIDRVSRKVTARQFLVEATPKGVDVHSTPVIAIDSKGYLHVIAGAHNGPFFYTRSLKPDRVDSEWTEPAPMGGGQTYAALVCDPLDRLHSMFRVHPRLCYQHKPSGADKWSGPFALVDAPPGHQGYTIYYHRIFVDRKGALYLSFTFFTFKTGVKARYPRALVMSEDGGKTWQLVTTKIFSRRVVREKEHGTPPP